MPQLCDDLLIQARELVLKDKRKPRQATVRRAVSTSYYALFHFFSDKVTRAIIGGQNDFAEVRSWQARALEHGVMKKVCKFFGNTTDPVFQDFETKLNFTTPPEIARIAQAFVELQELRHDADYDLSEPITKSDATKAIQQTDLAFRLWNALEQQQQHSKMLLIFSLSLLGGKTSAKR